jgi:hypothetical protein
MRKAEIFANNDEGIKCVYKNAAWLVSIKNWKPDNDIDGIHHLEVHHETDEQFILSAGKAILITANREDDKFSGVELLGMEPGKVYNVPKETWFYTITRKDTKMMYVQAADTSMENSDFIELSAEEVAYIKETAQKILAK